MAKYEVGDRVRSLVNEPSIGVKIGMEGNILSMTEKSFLILWAMNGGNEEWWIYKEGVELVRLVNPVFFIRAYEQPIEGCIKVKCDLTNGQIKEMADEINRVPLQVPSWDDSVEFTPTEMPKIDRFTFGYEDEYGMEITHKFHGTEFEYGLVDIVANFSLFLRGVGYTDEEIGEFINEGRM